MALCQCGCGQDAGVYALASRKRGWIKGQPKRYRVGHHGPSGPRTRYRGYVPNEPIAEAVKQARREGYTLSMISQKLGWGIDTTRLNRRLGLAATSSRKGKIHTKTIREDIAIAIIRAIDRSPGDFDL